MTLQLQRTSNETITKYTRVYYKSSYITISSDNIISTVLSRV